MLAVATAGAEQPALEAEDLLADAAILERVYRELHPGLLRYLSPDDVERQFRLLRADLLLEPTLPHAYLAFSRFAAMLRCGHTYANFYNQPAELRQNLFEQAPRLPFRFRWDDGRMLVTGDDTATGVLPPGTVVSAIDGVRTARILDRLLPYARADGHNDAKRIDQLGVRGTARYEAFDIFYPLLFGPRGDTVRVKAVKPGARRSVELSLRTLTFAQRIAPIAGREAARHGGDAALFDWRDLGDGIAYLRMPTWATYDSHWNWREWLDHRFEDLVAADTPVLVIDLRGNEGGEDVGDTILSHLVTAPVARSRLARLVRYRKVPADLRPVLDTWDPSFLDRGRRAQDLAHPWPTAPQTSFLALDPPTGDASTDDSVQPRTPRYGGRVFVLVDADVSSATFQFAQTVQSGRLGTLVGSPTGGNRRGIDGGAFFFVRLPHSHIELDLPLIGTFPSEPEPDTGLDPDIATRQTPADLASGTDVDLLAVRRAVAGGR